MKKSKKPEITPEQLLGDYNKIMEFVKSTLDKAQATMFVGKDGKPIQ